MVNILPITFNIGNDIDIVKTYKKLPPKSSSISGGNIQDFNDVLSNMVAVFPELTKEKVYITLSAGCGLSYKTFPTPLDSLLVNGSNTSRSEQRDALKDICLEHISRDKASDYSVSIFGSYTTDSDYILSYAFIESAFIARIKKAAAENGISLMDIQPRIYAVRNALNLDSFNQLVINMPDEIALINNLSIIGWEKNIAASFSDDKSLDLIASSWLTRQSQEFYGLDKELSNTIYIDVESIYPYLADSLQDIDIDLKSGLAASVVAAYGVQDVQEKQGDGMKDVADKIRDILNRAGKQSS